jgi:replication factor A1
MVMTVYTSNPFYRVDPESGNTVREDDDGNYATKDGKEVEEPENRLALSAVIDDGTGNIRTVFFRDRARELLEIDEEVEKEGDTDAVEEAAQSVVGKEVTIEGRTRHNDYFGQLEIIVNEMEETEIEEQLDSILEIMEA